MYTTYNKIVKVFESYPHVFFGFSDISFSEYKSKYMGALVFAVPHAKMLRIDDYNEETFEYYIRQAHNTSNEIISNLVEIFNEDNIGYEKPPISQTSEETLAVPLSFKFAAVHAGLGWIGKNGVLITEKYGPRIRLSAILINFDYPSGLPILESKCPEDCFLCVDACPHNALTGHQWNINSKRSDMINYQLCNQQRSLYIKTHNRKHACGFCMVSCTLGL